MSWALTGFATAAASAAGLLAVTLKKYSITSHGPNPLTLDAALNIIRNQHKYETALKAIEGGLNSCYRSERVNQAIGGVATSRHLRGLALDIHPGGRYKGDTTGAARRLYEMAERGELGQIFKVIDEPTWVHISWYDYDEPAGRPKLLNMRIVAGKHVYTRLKGYA